MAEQEQNPGNDEVVETVETNDWSFVPEDFVSDDGPDTQAFRASYDALVAEKAAAEERKAAIPKAEDYVIALPEDLELPEGLEFPKDDQGNTIRPELNDDDPEIPMLRQIAADLGIDQDGMNKILGLYAVKSLREEAEIRKAHDEEFKKLGPQAPARVKHIENSLKARLPEAQAQALLDRLADAEAVRAVEALLSANSTRTTGANPPPGKDLSTLKPLERLEYGQGLKKSA